MKPYTNMLKSAQSTSALTWNP